MPSKHLFALALVLTAFATPGCASDGPSTKEQVCNSFNALGEQVAEGNGIFGNPLFHRIGDLGDVASRYPDDGVARDGDSLKKIADADSLTIAELFASTSHIARLCDHPLSTNVLFGG